MKLSRLEAVFTLGLLVKAGALLTALLVAWPLFSSEPAVVQAQEKKQAAAEEKPKQENEPKAQEGENAQKPAQPAQQEKTEQPDETDPRVVQLLQERRTQIDLEAERLANQRKELEALRKEVEERVAELRKVQTALEELVAAEQKQRRQRIQQLVKVLSNMRAPSAAAVVEKLDDQMAVEIFKIMQSRTAGKVMAALPPKRAAEISALLARQQQTKKAGQLAGEAAKPKQ